MAKVTIKDIAQYAGVHRTTASKVLNNDLSCKVSLITRKRVLEVAEHLGFKRDNQFETPHEVLNIAIMGCPGRYREENPFYSDVFEGINIESQKNKLNIYLINDYTRMSIMQMVRQHSFLGIIALGGFTPQILSAMELGNKPLVAIEAFPEVVSPMLFSIKTDSMRGTYYATKYLIDCGHKNIFYIGFKSSNGKEDPKSFERFSGVAQALREEGLYHDGVRAQANMHSDGGIELDVAPEVGKRSMEMLLDQNPKPPFACVCYSDLHAFGAYRAVRQRGLRIPEDVSFIGYDNIPYTKRMNPPLTTINVPRGELGACAVRTILDIRKGDVPNDIILNNEFVERESVLKLK